ncbi:MAG: alpha/beta fold hydrolase [Pyrinomonadaceae bacterium]|nr:alpha/beta hydrolase [Acidobacteriota bacterium]
MNDKVNKIEPAFRHGYAQLGDVRLHYVECGVGERVVVLLHGFPEHWYSWRYQMLALGKSYRVIAPDMRGYNLSDKPASIAEYRMEKLVDDVTALIRYLGAREAAVVGHDWGAAVAWAVALRHPEYVWKLAALQAPPLAVWRRNLTLRQALKSWYMFFFQLPRVPEWWISRDDFAGLARMFKSTARRGTFTDADIAIYKDALRVADAKTETGALTAAINYYRANVFSMFGRASVNKRVRVPTLFIYGERDFAIVPETVRGVGDFIDAPYREVRLPNANHWVQVEYPVEVNEALSSFLDGE